MAMNEKAKQWVAELRSGKYKQGQGALRTSSNHFCCLGVLCDISYPEGWWKEFDEYDHYSFELLKSDDETNYYSEDEMPPEALIREVGLDYEDAKGLAKMNDSGDSFDEIADEIEKILAK